MSLRIIGAGVAGSFLYALAKDDYDLEVFDRNPAMRGHLCAWGCFHSQLKERLGKVGLNVEDYVLNKATNYVLNGINIRIRNQVSIDKPKMLKDLLPSKEVIKSEVPLKGGGMFTVNATTQPLGEYEKIGTAQFKTILKGLEPNTVYVHISPHYTGYAWAFPLSDDGKLWHLGAGCVDGDPLNLIRQIEKRYKFEESKRLCSCGRDLKIVDAKKAILIRDGVVSIGEAAGTVQPLSGEGIIPSMDSAELLYKSFLRGEPRYPAMGYYLAMRKLLDQYETPYKLWCLMHRHPRLAYLMGFRHMVKRAEQDIQPELTTIIKLRLLKEILFGH